LQIAAVAWLGQQRIFRDLIERFPERTRSLDSVSFLSKPPAILAAAGEFLGTTWSEAHLNSAHEGRLSRNSKDGKGYSRDARESEYRSAREAHGDEIAKVAAWSRVVADPAGIPAELTNPLT